MDFLLRGRKKVGEVLGTVASTQPMCAHLSRSESPSSKGDGCAKREVPLSIRGREAMKRGDFWVTSYALPCAMLQMALSE